MPKKYRPLSDAEVARRLAVRTAYQAREWLHVIQQIYGAGLLICERIEETENSHERIETKGAR